MYISIEYLQATGFLNIWSLFKYTTRFCKSLSDVNTGCVKFTHETLLQFNLFYILVLCYRNSHCRIFHYLLSLNFNPSIKPLEYKQWRACIYQHTETQVHCVLLVFLIIPCNTSVCNRKWTVTHITELKNNPNVTRDWDFSGGCKVKYGLQSHSWKFPRRVDCH